MGDDIRQILSPILSLCVCSYASIYFVMSGSFIVRMWMSRWG